MHSANTHMACTESNGLPATEEQPSLVWDGIARSALIVLRKGMAIESRLASRVWAAISGQPSAKSNGERQRQ